MLKVKIIALIISPFFIGCGGGATTDTTTSTKDSIEFTKPEHQQILNAINEARTVARDCNDGLGLVGPAQPLAWNNELYAASYEHSHDLAQSNTFGHKGSGTHSDITGSNNGTASIFYERIEANGYTDYKAVGENIAAGQESIESAMEAWLNSPDHCTNIMSDKFEEVAVAIVSNPDSDYEIYWTQNFGTQK